MKWSIVTLIFRREVRDQLRDRRTMFMIVVLPVLLYPALGLGMLQMSMRFGQERRTVGVVGFEYLPATPPLLGDSGDRFDPKLLEAVGVKLPPNVVRMTEWSKQDVLTRKVNAILIVPPDASKRLTQDEQVEFRIVHNGVDDESEVARRLLRGVLRAWSDAVVVERMKSLGKPPLFAEPVRVDDREGDVSTARQRSGTAWGKVVPFILVMMALTGAFYPAVDLCAGEKERGTMETLLITPASRGEIVFGKFLTVFAFSVATTIFNLASMGLTFNQVASLIRSQAPAVAGEFSPPGAAAVFWMLVLMLPLAGFFAALCMALAIFARSSKEGQYYLMPMFLVVTPLVFLTLAPGVELTPFYSLVPVTNVALLLRSLLLNEYEKATLYLLPVMTPTVLYGYLALRYAIDQFNREEVLFREAEPLNVRLWIRHLLRDKQETPSSGEAWFCYVLLLLLTWYSQGRLPPSLASVAISQLALIGFPAVLLAVLLTSNASRTLSLRRPAWLPALFALALVPAVHPVATTWGEKLKDLMPASEEINEAFARLLGDATLADKLFVLAIVPAVCEELAFRGFILSGLLRKHPPGRAIFVSAILFGVFHMIPEQMVTASLLGVVLGLVATRTGSIFPGMVFHALHNGLIVVRASEGQGGYSQAWVCAGALAAAILVGTLVTMPSRLPERRRRPR